MVKKHWKLIGLVLLIGLMACPVTHAAKDKGGVASQLEKQMWVAAKKMDFERAASLRDKLKQLKMASQGGVERKVKESEVPKAALKALKKLARGAKITEFAEEIEHGSTFYEGSWKARSGAKMDVLVTPTGDLVEIEEQVGIKKVPAAVLKAARKAAGKGTQLAFEKKTMILYEVKFRKVDSRHELLLTPDGRRVEEEVEKGKSDDDGDDDKDKKKDEHKSKKKHKTRKHHDDDEANNDDDNEKHKMKAKCCEDDDNEKHKMKAKCCEDDDEDGDDEDEDDEDCDDEDGDDEGDDDEDCDDEDGDDEDEDDGDDDNDDEGDDDENDDDEDGDDEGDDDDEDEDADDEEDEDADDDEDEDADDEEDEDADDDDDDDDDEDDDEDEDN